MESQKPTRDERSWVIGIREVGFNINDDAFNFDIHKNNCLPNIQSFRANKVGLRPPEIGQTEQKLTPLEARFIQIISRRVAFLQQTRFV